MFTVAALGLRRFLRDRSNLFMSVVLPFLVIFLVGQSAGGQSTSTVGIVESDDPLASLVLEELDLETEPFADRAAAFRAVEDTAIPAAIVFETNGSIEFLARPDVARDARAALDDAVAAANQRFVAHRQGALVGVDAATIDAAFATTAPVTVSSSRLGSTYWEGLDDFESSALTQVVLFTVLAALIASGLLVEERNSGMSRRKATAPLSMARLVAGETLGRFTIAGSQALLIVVVSAALFSVGWGNPLLTTLALALTAMVATGLGIIVANLFDSASSANGFAIMTGIVMAALGGAMAPVEIFPPVMQTVARATPHFWAIDALQSSMTGGAIADALPALAVLAAMAGVVLSAATWLHRRRLFG